MAIAGYAIGSDQGYVYVRAEYPIAVERLENAIGQANDLGLLGENIFGTDFSFDLEIRLGAGAFVCGETTALTASIEGRRGTPRSRPPYSADKGLWGKPTMINNVEIFANIPYIQMCIRDRSFTFVHCLQKIGARKERLWQYTFIWAVSYTHLDVYKRQVASGIVGATVILSGMKEAEGPADMTSSGLMLFKISMMILPLVIIALSYFIYRRFYKIDEEFFGRIVDELAVRKQDSEESHGASE